MADSRWTLDRVDQQGGVLHLKEIRPVIEPAELVLVVARQAKDPATGKIEPYTHPKRQLATLKVDAAFDGTATLTCSNASAVKLFSAATGGIELKLDGNDNVFKPGASPAWTKGASLAKGVTVYAEAVTASKAANDISLKLALTAGSKQVGPDAVCTITDIEITLDIYGDGRSGQAGATPLSQDDKVYVGRKLPVYASSVRPERAKLVIRQVKPADFEGELELKAKNALVTAFNSESEQQGKIAALPFVIAANKIPPDGQKLWAQALTPSKAARDTGFVIGPNKQDNPGDVVAVTSQPLLCLTFDDGPDTSTPALLDVLRDEGVVATFFVCAGKLAGNPTAQSVLKRAIAEGHALGNHGYVHEGTANDDYYIRRTKTEEVKKNFIKNRDTLAELLNYRELSVARLQGQGKVHGNYVQMIKTEVGESHVGWDAEFSTNEIARSLKHISHSVDDIVGVKSETEGLPRMKVVVALLHDSHWVGKIDRFAKLLKWMKTQAEIVPLVPLPEGLKCVTYR